MAVGRSATGRQCVVDRSTPVQSAPSTGRDFLSTGRHSDRAEIDRAIDRSRILPIGHQISRELCRPVVDPHRPVDQETIVSSPSDVTKSSWSNPDSRFDQDASYASEASMAHRSYCKACSFGNLGLRPSYAKDSSVLPPFLQRIHRGYL